jgi:hypothetical protein
MRNVVRILCLCCAALCLLSQVGSAAIDEGDRPARPSGGYQNRIKLPEKSAKTAADAAKKARKPPLAKQPIAKKKQPAAQATKPTDWLAGLSKLAPADVFKLPLFPLPLVTKGAGFIRLFRAGDESSPAPKLISVQCSRQFLEQYFQRAVEGDEIVSDMILGTKIDGQMHLSGAIGLTLQPNNRELRFDLVFAGVCRSQTAGVNSVVVLQNTADTLFQAQKHFIWNSHGLTYSPATAIAETHSTTNRIDTVLPGLIGRIATQIAAGRVAQVHNQADEIAAQHAADRIEQALDQRVDEALAGLESISRQLPAASYLTRTTRTKLSSSREQAQLLVLRRDAKNTPALVKMEHLPRDCDVLIQIHREMFRELARDPAALMAAMGVVMQLLAAENPPGAAQVVAPQGQFDWQFAPSTDGQWLVVRHVGRERGPAAQPAAIQPRAHRSQW